MVGKKYNRITGKVLSLMVLFFISYRGYAQTTQTLTTASSSPWAVPTGVTSVTVQCWGGGGGGGYAITTNGAAGGGGGGGAYTYSVIAVTAGANISFTVGAGGAGGTTGGTAAKAGTASTFSSTATVNANGGGAGGSTNSATNGTAGVGATGGTYSGGNGFTGINGTAGGGGGGSAGTASNGNSATSQTGAVAVTGGGGGGTGVQSGQNDGTAPGGGGSGGERKNNGLGNQAGGNGGDGQIVLTYCQAISVSTQPANTTVNCSGGSTSFSVNATGSIASYQWQRDPNTGTFADITSSSLDAGVTYNNYNTATLNLTGVTSSVNNYKYRCVITASAACSQTVTTSSATLSASIGVPLNGSYTIGGAGSPNYSSLTAAFAAMSCAGISGNVNLILQSGYVSTVETFPLVAYPNATSYSITIYPAVSGLSITSSNATGTFDFDNADNYIVDGRVNQTGSMDLVIENTNTSAGYTIKFINDASYNTIKYCNVKGVTTATYPSSVILFSTASANGNDYNTIDHCDVHDGATTPTELIICEGTTGMENDNVTISNCNLYNFYTSGSYASAIDLETGATDWTITGNSMYQTATRTPAATSGTFVLYISNTTSGKNFTITNNYIGGTAASCGGTALTWDAAGTQDEIFYGMSISTTTVSSCNVTGNTFANINYGSKCKQASANTIEFEGFLVGGGYVNLSNNTIGSTTGTGNIAINYATTSTQAFNIDMLEFQGVQGTFSNNNIGSITVTGGNTAKSNSFTAIDLEGSGLIADVSVSGNTVGSISTANSIQYAGSTATILNFNAINAWGANSKTVTISGNIIQNITNTSTGTTATYGIYNYNAGSTYAASIQSNTVANVSSARASTGSIYGIYIANTTASQTISNNIIHDISNTYNGATATDVHGIYFAGNTGTASTVSANKIYNLTLSSTSSASVIYGIRIFSGLATTSNNMITLGNGLTSVGYAIYGINMAGSSGNNFYHNSVYLSGALAGGGSNTFCFYSSVTNTRTVKNNAFYNARTSTVKNFAIGVSSATGLTSDYNDLYDATAANVGTYDGGTTARTFAAWQTGTGGDANSINSDPSYTGAVSADLHLASTSPCINKGVAGTGISIDYDGETRNGVPDIGCDEYHLNYYSKSTGFLNVLATWGPNTDGTGTPPTSFTLTNTTFNIYNNTAPTINGSWAVSGAGGLVILGDGITATNFVVPASSAFTGTINVSATATLTLQNATVPTLNLLNVSSTVDYNAPSGTNQTVSSGVTYGNLTLSNSTGSGSTVKSLAANISIAGNLTINPYAKFDMLTYNANRTGGGGTLSIATNGTLSISGTSNGASTNNNFPNNFNTSLNANSLVEYYGATQTTYPGPTYGNMMITTVGTKTAGGAHTIAGAFTINSGATFAASTYTHNFKGNFIGNGTFTAGTSTSNFNGTSAQIISGSSTTTFYKFILNNSTGVTLSAPVNINNALTLTSGLLTTDATNILTMQNGSTAPAIKATSVTYVNGPMKYQKASSGSSALNFPIGTSPDCRPFTLTVNHASASQYNYTAQLFNANPWTAFGSTSTDIPTTVDTISGVHYWTISRTDASNASQPSMELSGNQQIQLYFGTNDGVYQGSSLTIVKNTAATPATWIDIGGSSSLGNFSSAQVGSVTSTSSPSAFSSFSSFSLGSKSTGWNPLPIELLAFTAVLDGEKVDVKWVTSTESNNKFFTIERSSDGINFSEIATINSKALNGNSKSPLSYNTTDLNPLNGVSYYRLKQTDYNGKYKYFNMVSVDLEPSKNVTFSIYPNPNSGEFIVDFSGIENNHEVQIILHDELGKEVYSNSIYSNSITSNKVQIIPSSKIAKGNYFCSLIFEGIKRTIVVVVN